MGAIGKGTTVSKNTGSGAELLAAVSDCSLPASKVASVDGTHYTSPNNLIAKRSGIWVEQDDVTLTLELSLSQYEELQALLGVDDVAWVITIPLLAMKFSFTGFVGNIGGGSIAMKDIVRLPVTITPQSLITPSAAA